MYRATLWSSEGGEKLQLSVEAVSERRWGKIRRVEKTVLRMVMMKGLPGTVLFSSSSLSSGFVLDSAISGGSPTSASRMGEVSINTWDRLGEFLYFT